MCEPVTLAALASAGTYGAASAGLIGATTTAAGVTTAMTTAQALSLAATVGSSVMAAGSSYQQSKVAEQTARNNAKMAEVAAQDAIKRGEEEAINVQRKGAALKAAQQVSFASKGLDLSYGTAADLQDQTDFFTQQDVATTRNNARKEAWNMRARGQAQLAQGQADSLNSMYQAGGSLLGGAGAVADKWYTYTKGR